MVSTTNEFPAPINVLVTVTFEGAVSFAVESENYNLAATEAETLFHSLHPELSVTSVLVLETSETTFPLDSRK